jgi:hypothetical protein
MEQVLMIRKKCLGLRRRRREKFKREIPGEKYIGEILLAWFIWH